jgi:NAD(P)H-quinone oxidoreductase subunit 4L
VRVGVEAFVMLAAVLFSLGLYGAVSKKATVQVLMSLELMAVAININLVALSRFVSPRTMDGLFFAVFSMVDSAAEVGLGLALVLAVYKCLHDSEVTGLSKLKG